MTCQEIIQKMVETETDTNKLEAFKDFCELYFREFENGDANGINAYNKCKKLIDIWPEMMALLLSLSICGVKSIMPDLESSDTNGCTFEDFKSIGEIDMDKFFSEE